MCPRPSGAPVQSRRVCQKSETPTTLILSENVCPVDLILRSVSILVGLSFLYLFFFFFLN